MNFFKTIIIKIIRFFYHFFWVFPIKDQIVICSFGGKNYNDNPKYLAEEIIKRYPKFRIICLLKNINTEVPSYVIKVKNHSLKMLYVYATSKIWISNARLPLFIKKRKGQYYVETWHGGFALKKIGVAMQDISKFGEEIIKHDAQQADIMLSNSDFCTKIYRKDFLFTGQILEVGTPRLDDFLNPDITFDISKIINNGKMAKIAMYAPTFRDNGRIDVYDLDFGKVKKSLEEKYSGDWVILVRFHPLMQNYSKNITFSDWLIDVNGIADIYSLLKCVDVLITDYSSLGFEFGLSGKKVLLYAKDVEEYTETRGMYFNIHELPFSLCRNNTELIDTIRNLDDEKYGIALSEFYTMLGCKEKGRASEKVIDYMVKNTDLFS